MVNKVREIHFIENGDKLIPRDIFENSYSSLDNLIGFNTNHALDSKNFKLDDRFMEREKVVEIEREKIYDVVKETVHNINLDLSALIYFDNGNKEFFEIRPRTNFDSTLKKRPNIVYLTSQFNDEVFILRESRNYPEDSLIDKKAKFVFGNNYHGNVLVKEKVKTDLNRNDVLLIPEPNLLLALEQIILEKGFSRITPYIKIIGNDKNSMWSIRNSLLSIDDGHLDLGKFLEYEGILNGLGLMDVLDNQYQHYCLGRNDVVVNIDPDFLTYTPNQKIINQVDWMSFKKLFEKKTSLNGTAIKKKYNELRFSKIKFINEQMGGKTLLDYLPSELHNAPALDFLALDNYGEFN